jgi:Ca2+-binding RTX toxin-like protein
LQSLTLSKTQALVLLDDTLDGFAGFQGYDRNGGGLHGLTQLLARNGIPDVPESKERIALLDAYYAGVLALRQPPPWGNLTFQQALTDPDPALARAKTWVLLEYYLVNKPSPSRRADEAKEFGLTGDKATLQDVEKAVGYVFTQYDTIKTNKLDSTYRGIPKLMDAVAPQMTTLETSLTANQRIDYVQVIGIGENNSNVLTARQIPANLGGPTNRATNNLLIGQDGDDTLNAGPGNDFAYGGNGNNVLNGYTGTSQGNIDVLVGGPGGTLPPSFGNNTLNAGSGSDLMIGDGASGTFVVNSNQYPRTANIIWGDDSQSNTYKFSGQNLVFLQKLPSPTLQSVLQQYGTKTGFAAEFNQVAHQDPSTFAISKTIILDPSFNDRIVNLDTGDINPVQWFGIPLKPNATEVQLPNNFNYTVGHDPDIIVAGYNDTVTDGFANETLIAPDGTDTLNGNGSGDVMVATDNASKNATGADTLVTSGANSEIMIGNDYKTTFDINNFGANQSPIDFNNLNANTNAIDVVWANGSTKDNLNITTSPGAGFNILEVNDPAATVASVENLNALGLAQKLFELTGFAAEPGLLLPHYSSPFFDMPTIVIVNPSDIATLSINGQQLTAANVTAVSGSLPGLPGEGSTENFLTIPQGFILGFTQGDFGMNDVPAFIHVNASANVKNYVDNGTPTLNLQDFQQGGSSSAPPPPSDPSVIDQAAVFGQDFSDTLLTIHAATIFGLQDTLIGQDGDDTLTSQGSDNTLIAVSGANTLTSNGFDNTLFGDAGGSTLTSATSPFFNFGTVAAYAIDNVDFSLYGGTANVNGSSVSDTLAGITTAEVFGANDTLSDYVGVTFAGGSGAPSLPNLTLIAGGQNETLIGEASETTLISDAAGNTIIDDGRFGNATVAYGVDNLTVNLGAGTAGVNGSSLSDTLIGVTAATLSGQHDTGIVGSGAGTLVASSNNDTLIGDGQGDTLSVSGFGGNDTLIGGIGSDTLLSNGSGDSLVAGTRPDLLSSDGFEDTLFGNAAGSTLTGGFSAIAAYTQDDVTVDLNAGTATVNGSGISDTLTGISTIEALGSNDTLIAGTTPSTLIAAGVNDTLIGASGSTLIGNGGGNTLLAGTGGSAADYTINNVTVDLATGTATVNGSSTSDTLVGFNAATVSGQQDTLIGGNGNETLSSIGSDNVVIGGTGADTLLATNFNSGNTLIAGSGADTLLVTGSDNTLIGATGADVLSASGFFGPNTGNVLIAGAGADTLLTSESGDTLIGDGAGATLLSSGSDNTLIAGDDADTLVTSGTDDTLFGSAAGSTLDGTAGVGTVAAYSIDNVAVDLAAGTATANGASVSDTLLGITTAAALGSNDTLIGGPGSTTLISNAAGNTLVAGSGVTIAAYTRDDVAVDLSTATARVNGSGISDTLVGIVAATVSGRSDTIVAGSGIDTLSSTGTNNTLFGGSGADTLSTSGASDTLLAGSGASTLASTGTADTLIGNGGGSTLDGSAGPGTVAAYTVDNVTVNLGAGTASVNGTSAADTLIGINTVAALGSADTLIGGGGASTLFSNAGGNTLVGGAGATVAAYALNNVTVDLPAGIARVNGSSTFDALNDISAALVTGSDDTMIGGAGTDLMSSGSDNTLIAGSGVETLTSDGTNDTLFGNGLGSTLQLSQPFGVISSGPVTAAYTLDNMTIDVRGFSGTAGVNGSGIGDQLDGISVIDALGTDDTLITTDNNFTFLSNASGNTLIAESGANATAAYSVNDLTVNLAAGTAIVNGASSGDTLIGIMSASVSGDDDTLIGSGTGDTLTGDASTVLFYSENDFSVDLTTGSAGVSGTNAADRLNGIMNVTVAGAEDTVTGGFGQETLNATGANDTLIAGVGAYTLTVSGSNDTVIGGVGGGTLQAAPGATGAVISYVFDRVTVDLATGEVTSPYSSASDSLIGFSAATVGGSFDTIVGGSGVETLSSTGSDNTLIAGSGADTLLSSGNNDLLVGGSGANILLSSGLDNTLFAGSGADTLTSTGTDDTLVGNAAGSTLIGSGGTGAIAAYTLDDAVVDLATGTAYVNGSSLSDTLIGITSAAVFGSNDTVIGDNGTDVLMSDGQNNTLIAGSGADTLVSGGTGDTLMAGSGADLLVSSGRNNTLIAGTGTDSLTTSGTGDTLQGGSGTDVLSSSGTNNTLIAGSAADTLASTGAGDTLIGNAAGSTLDGSAGSDALAAYTTNNVAVDLATGTASLNGSSASDTLIGINTIAALGSGDTLTGGSGASTLISNAAGNTLVAGTGQTDAHYGQDDIAVDLSAGTAIVNGAGVGDMLVGITDVAVTGTNDTVTGGSGTDILSSSGFDNTLIAGGGIDTLTSSGDGDTLIGNAAGSTLDGSAGTAVVAAYTINDVTVDFTANTASVNGSSVSDTLIGITAADALGTDDTLIGGPDTSTLISDGGGNTLIGGAGATTLPTVSAADFPICCR